MTGLTKRKKAAREKIESTRLYEIDEALALVKEFATAKFPESIDISVNLGVDPRKSDQVVRGSTVLPNGTGKSVRVAVFAQGENADKAKAAGADIVGFEDLAEQIKGGKLDFEVVIATPDAMRVVGTLGQILGPRGLMPNPKVGTVTADVETAVKNAKAGQVRYRTDKAGIIHCPIGRADFEVPALKENLTALLTDLKKSKPAQSKGAYLKKLTVSSSMGPGVSVDRASVDV
jgi:large subunit ribosomal protein L1